MKKSIPTDISISLYHTLVQPYFYYCNIVRCSDMSTVLERLFVKQKKAVRIVMGSKWNAHTQPIFKRFKVLTLLNINKLQIYCFMYTIINRRLNLFTFNSDMHDHSTRLASKRHINPHNTKLRKFRLLSVVLNYGIF